MQLISNRYISTEEVRRLSVGSFEHLIARIEEAVRAEAVQLFGAKIESSVTATFQGYAIVLAEDGRFVRVKYEDKKGQIKILGHEPVKVESIAPDKLDSYLNSESQKAVDAFLAGDVSAAMTRLKSLVPFVENKTAPQDDRMVDAMVAFYRSDRPWRRVFTEKADTIRRLVLDEVAAIHEDRLQVKFRPLYDGSVSGADLEKYRELVIENLQKIGERSGTLIEQVSVAVRDVKAKKLDDEAVVSLVAFGEDLIEDLNATRATVRGAAQRVRKIDCLGKLHDTFAEDFRDRELAGRFVMKMSQRLGDAHL